jgi:hypothetical protein
MSEPMTEQEIEAARKLCSLAHPADPHMSCADCCDAAVTRRDLAALVPDLLAQLKLATSTSDGYREAHMAYQRWAAVHAPSATGDEAKREVIDARLRDASPATDVTDWAVMYRQVAGERDRLAAKLISSRRLSDGTEPAVGQRVVTVREVATKWGLAHAHDDLVHEITSLLGGHTHLVECGAKQVGVGMLKLAPAGADVTCRSCRGWREQMARMRADAEVYRAEQIGEVHRFKADLEAALREVERLRPFEREIVGARDEIAALELTTISLEEMCALVERSDPPEEPTHPVTLTLDHACDCCGAILRVGEDVAHFDGEGPEDVAIMHWGPCPEPDRWRIEYRLDSAPFGEGPVDAFEAFRRAMHYRGLCGVTNIRLVRVRKEPARG